VAIEVEGPPEAMPLPQREGKAIGEADALVGEPREDNLVAYQDARDAGELRLRIRFMPGGQSEVYAGLKSAGLRSGFGDDWIRIGAVKYAADGSASERTMRMSTPYAGRPDDHGILTMDQAQIDAAVDDALANGFRIGIHANGDVTIAMVLDAYERALAGWTGPNFTPGPFEPMMALQSLVTRKDRAGRVWGPSQRITLEEALRVCTVHGAYASFEEGIKGSLTPGKLADCVLLEKDPRDVDPDQLVGLKVVRTVLGGRTVHEA
jgi:predicted amidohydrolase YtcJ